MEKGTMLKALRELDALLKAPVQILVGGGAAMLLAHKVPLSTADIDGLLVHSEMTPAELDSLVKKVGRVLKINPHWFSSFFSSFTYTVPPDHEKRRVLIYKGKNLKVFAFGLSDLLVMKCFSRREKDVGHARALVKRGADLKFVDDHIQGLADKGIPGAKEALDFLDDIREQEGR